MNEVRHKVEYHPPPQPDLSKEAQFAVLLRALYDLGYDDHLAGHATWWQADRTALINPFELAWDEVCASDIGVMDANGYKISGRYSVTGAIELHCAIKRARPDVCFVIHDHPRWSVVWADCKRVPPIFDQTSAQVGKDLIVVNEFAGTVNNISVAEGVAKDMGTHEWALLGNHGVVVTAPTIESAYLRAATLEWRCQRAWEVEALGSAEPMDPEQAAQFGDYFEDTASGMWWDSVVRRQLRKAPEVLK